MGPGPDSGAMNSSPGGFNQPKSADAKLGMDASCAASPWAPSAEPSAAPAHRTLARIALVRFIGANTNIEKSLRSLGTYGIYPTPGNLGKRARQDHCASAGRPPS